LRLTTYQKPKKIDFYDEGDGGGVRVRWPLAKFQNTVRTIINTIITYKKHPVVELTLPVLKHFF
jgi:hypothetical protein